MGAALTQKVLLVRVHSPFSASEVSYFCCFHDENARKSSEGTILLPESLRAYRETYSGTLKCEQKQTSRFQRPKHEVAAQNINTPLGHDVYVFWHLNQCFAAKDTIQTPVTAPGDEYSKYLFVSLTVSFSSANPPLIPLTSPKKQYP